MARVFFPGCKVKARYPEASAWLADQVVERGWADEVAGCCRVNHQRLTPEDTAVCVCNNCMAMIDEDADNGGLDNVWQLIDADDSFPLPDYTGWEMAVQDCGRAYDRTGVQDAVRSLLHKMGIATVELEDARENCVHCGVSTMAPAPAQDAGFAPWRYVEDAARRGMFVERTEEEKQAAVEAHCAAIPTDRVACYCTACDAALESGGKDAVNLIELVSGRFRA